MAKKHTVETVVTKRGKEITSFDQDAFNDDWIRSARLVKKSDEGSNKAQKEIEKLESTPIFTITKK